MKLRPDWKRYNEHFWSMRIKSASMVFFTFALLSVAASAQVVEGRRIVRAELITDANDFSNPFTVGIKFTIEPDWYLYWINPGVAGLPIDVQWELPNGWSASKILHPVPQKFVHDELIAYGYKREVVLLSTISPAQSSQNSAKPPRISAKLDWLVCKESCIRGTAEVLLKVESGERSKRAREILERTQTQIPEPLARSAITIEQASISGQSSREIRIVLGGTGAADASDFFPEPLSNAVIEHNTIRVKDNTIVMTVTPNSESGSIRELRGLLLVGGKGYDCVIPLKPNP